MPMQPRPIAGTDRDPRLRCFIFPPAFRRGRRPPTLGRSINRMEVTVRLFAMLRERAGANEVTLELPDGARVSDALGELGHVTDGIPVVMAVNREYADASQ